LARSGYAKRYAPNNKIGVVVKRPRGVYPVAFWFYFGIAGLIWNPISKVVLPKTIQNQDIITAIKTTVLIGVLLVIIGIIQVKKISRNIALALFGLLSVYQVYAIVAFLILGPVESKVIGYKLLLTVPSICCVIYLLLPSFRIRAKEFLVYKEEEAERKRILKQMPNA